MTQCFTNPYAAEDINVSSEATNTRNVKDYSKYQIFNLD